MPTTEETLNAEIVDEPRENQLVVLANNPLLLLSLLFLVTGFLGIPLIFYSTRMSMWQKLVLSLVVTVYTCVLIWGTYAIVMWSWGRIAESL